MMGENERSPDDPRLILPDEPPQRPQALKKPWSPGMRMAAIGVGFVALASAWALVENGGSDQWPSTEPAFNVTDAVTDPEDRSAVAPPFHEIEQQGVLLATGFPDSWNATASGNQIIFVSPDGSVNCQSLVLPLTEHRQMLMPFEGDFSAYAQQAALSGVEEGRRITGRDLSATIAASEPISGSSSEWSGTRFVVNMEAPQGAVRQTMYAAASVSGDRAATITCGYLESSPVPEESVAEIVRAYRIVS